MKLSIVIVNYNVRYFLDQCLISVMKAIDGMDAEVFVVDNNSVDGSVAMITERYPEVRLIANKENTGFSRANNQAIRLAQGEYILLLNPDTVVQEDTFRLCIEFMDAHPEAGGLGVKMVDGKGRFLPESKRGLPTPQVAFYKIFGLSKLFPSSPRFGRYHLGHLSNDEVHEIEILSGAYMFMRKKTLDEVGFLDESFFMYGEDIDLSWRIVLGGWKNYYFPKTRIIHYKGESTKKGSLNYVYVFYNAMVIFARKHFSERHAKWFSFFIHLAIWLRAGAAVLFRFLKGSLLPVADVLLTLGSIWILKEFYSDYQEIPYNDRLVVPVFGAAMLIWLVSAFFGGAYDRPLRPLRPVKSLLAGSLMILLIYSLLPEHLRFSRALILGGSFIAIGTFVLTRTIFNLVTSGRTGWSRRLPGNTVIVGKSDEADRVRQMVGQVDMTSGQWHYVSPNESVPDGYAGHLGQLDEIVRVHQADQVIFCARDVSLSAIIGAMSDPVNREAEFKIAPPESLYIIGSNSIETTGDVFMLDVNSISRPKNIRNKRFLDVVVSLTAFALIPVLLIISKDRLGLISNLWNVLTGRKSWVGYAAPAQGSINQGLPRIRRGVLNPLSPSGETSRMQEHIQKLNLVYAKDYRMRNDLNIILRCIRQLGNQS